MTLALRILLIFVAFVSIWGMLHNIKKSKLQIEYTIFWLVFGALLVVLSIFPDIMFLFADLLGVYSPANLVFAFVIFVLLIKCFFMTIEMSNLETKMRELVQKMALMEYEGKKDEDKAN